jgi:hypothetical protein
MTDGHFFGSARWLLRRLLAVLLVALAVAVVTRQLTDLGDSGEAQRPATAVRGPLMNRDHWHAAYAVVICGQRQPNFPTWEAGVHTHADGIIHIHPFVPSEEKEGARLTKWFEYGGGLLTQTEMRMPGTPPDQVYRNGGRCDDGSAGALQLFVNGERLDDWSGYIPQDGDRVLIEFGPRREAY